MPEISQVFPGNYPYRAWKVKKEHDWTEHAQFEHQWHLSWGLLQPLSAVMTKSCKAPSVKGSEGRSERFRKASLLHLAGTLTDTMITRVTRNEWTSGQQSRWQQIFADSRCHASKFDVGSLYQATSFLPSFEALAWLAFETIADSVFHTLEACQQNAMV